MVLSHDKRCRTVENGEGRWGTIVSRWWTECHHGSRWPESGNGTVDFFLCNLTKSEISLRSFVDLWKILSKNIFPKNHSIFFFNFKNRKWLKDFPKILKLWLYEDLEYHFKIFMSSAICVLKYESADEEINNLKLVLIKNPNP